MCSGTGLSSQGESSPGMPVPFVFTRGSDCILAMVKLCVCDPGHTILSEGAPPALHSVVISGERLPQPSRFSQAGHS